MLHKLLVLFVKYIRLLEDIVRSFFTKFQRNIFSMVKASMGQQLQEGDATQHRVMAVIVDDEPNARVVLRLLLGKSEYPIDVVAECRSLEAAVIKIKELQPTVVFLDVQMPHFAGYEIVDFFEVINFEIIFVTAYDEYALRAFDMNAMDYLVKPIERARLSQTLQKLHDRVCVQRKTKEYEYLLKSMKNRKSEKLIIPEAGDRRVVEIGDVVAVEANGAYTSFIMHGTEHFIASKNLKYFEKRLAADARFFRCHRTYIVKLDYVETLNKMELQLQLRGEHRVKIARSRIEAFENLMF